VKVKNEKNETGVVNVNTGYSKKLLEIHTGLFFKGNFTPVYTNEFLASIR